MLSSHYEDIWTFPSELHSRVLYGLISAAVPPLSSILNSPRNKKSAETVLMRLLFCINQSPIAFKKNSELSDYFRVSLSVMYQLTLRQSKPQLHQTSNGTYPYNQLQFFNPVLTMHVRLYSQSFIRPLTHNRISLRTKSRDSAIVIECSAITSSRMDIFDRAKTRIMRSAVIK